MNHYHKGVSLIEMMIAVAILGIITAIAVPLITDYTSTARAGVMRDNIETIRLFEENLRLAERAYIGGAYDPDDPDDADGLKALLGWEPRTESDTVTYNVVCGVVTVAPRCTVAGGFYVTAVDSRAPGEPLCVSFGPACP